MKSKTRSVNNLIKTLALFDIKKVGTHYRLSLIEDEFAYFSPIGEPFHFVLIHDGTPERFAKDFKAYLNCLSFKATKYEQDVASVLTEACSTIERLANIKDGDK